MRQRRPRLRIADRSEQAERLHGLENALNVATAAIVTAQPDPHAGLPQIKHRRNATLQFQVAQVIENDAGVGGRHAIHLGPRDPDTVHDVELWPYYTVTSYVVK